MTKRTIKAAHVAYGCLTLKITIDGVTTYRKFSTLWEVDDSIPDVGFDAPLVTEITLADAKAIVSGMVEKAREA